MVVNQKGQSCRPGHAAASRSSFAVLAWVVVFSLVTAVASSEVLSLRCGTTTGGETPGEGRSLPDLPFNVQRGYGFIGGKAQVLETGTNLLETGTDLLMDSIHALAGLASLYRHWQSLMKTEWA